MAIGTTAKTIRNRRIVEMKDRTKTDGKRMTFDQVAKIMNLSIQRTKYLYYREKKLRDEKK